MKKKIAIAFAGLLLMLTASFAPIAQAPVPGSDLYVTMGGKVDGLIYLYVQNYAPNCRIPYGGIALPMPFPYFTRAPYLSPNCLLENITFGPPIDVNADNVSDIIQISKIQVNPIVHYVFVGPPARPPPGAWWRFMLVAPAAGGGVIFINPYMPGDVDCYTMNNDTGVWWAPPSPLAGTKAAESGGFMTNVSGVFNPSIPSRFPSAGLDGIPGTALWGDPADGFGDGVPDPPGSSILMLPLMLMGDEYNATSGQWQPTMGVPMPLILTTGTAYDHVASVDPTPGDPPGECFLTCMSSTEVGLPWDDAFVKVTYVCAWSNLLYCLNPDDDGNGVPDPDATGMFYTMDAFYEYVEKKVLLGHQIADVNGDDKVDIFDIVMAAVAYGSQDEGLGFDGVPGTADDKYMADHKYEPRADFDCNGVINIKDIVRIALDFGKTDC